MKRRRPTAEAPKRRNDDNRRNPRDPRMNDESRHDLHGSSSFDDWGDGKRGDSLGLPAVGPEPAQAWRGTGGSSGRGAYGGGGEKGDERGGYSPDPMRGAVRAPYHGTHMGAWDDAKRARKGRGTRRRKRG
jgi:hypothetical protein